MVEPSLERNRAAVLVRLLLKCREERVQDRAALVCHVFCQLVPRAVVVLAPARIPERNGPQVRFIEESTWNLPSVFFLKVAILRIGNHPRKEFPQFLLNARLCTATGPNALALRIRETKLFQTATQHTLGNRVIMLRLQILAQALQRDPTIFLCTFNLVRNPS